jgi:hypothetical protein
MRNIFALSSLDHLKQKLFFLYIKQPSLSIHLTNALIYCNLLVFVKYFLN